MSKRKWQDELASASSSTTAAVIPPARPPAKRQRKGKAKDPQDPPAEKRGAIFKRTCPRNILDRVDRVNSQRFFMVDRTRQGDQLREEFSVLGSTGNVYTVVIDKKPSCNCPDALKGNHCKHILFVFLKVLQVPRTSGSWYQKALLTSELEDIFARAPLAPNDVANARVREAYAKATGKSVAPSDSEPSASTQSAKKLPGPEDDCAVCYDQMHGVPEGGLTFCEDCGNALHDECFRQWAKTCRAKLTCVYCRATWVSAASASASAGAGGASSSSEGYLNLGGLANLSPVRDTSTYYDGSWGRKGYYRY